MTSHEDIRLQRINKIKRTLDEAKKKNKELDREKFIAVCCIEWGTTRRTVLEYFKMIDLAYGK